MVEDGAFSHTMINLKGHPNHINGSKLMEILLNGWNLPIGGVASGKVCVCRCCSILFLYYLLRLRGGEGVFQQTRNYFGVLPGSSHICDFFYLQKMSI